MSTLHEYKIDRSALPRPAARPLIFKLTNDFGSVEAEVCPDAALEYMYAPIGPWLLLADRVETFLVLVEAAVARVSDQPQMERITLSYHDLYVGM